MDSGGRPDGVPASEILVLHDPESEKSLVVLFVENEADYREADETLNSMPASETRGTRTSVVKYDVAFRMNA